VVPAVDQQNHNVDRNLTIGNQSFEEESNDEDDDSPPDILID
jgi:hypothetical protein